MKVKILLAAIGVSAFLFYFSSCSKNNATELGAATCDTVRVSYTTQIVPILQDNCYVCHKGTGASSGIDFSSYDDFAGWALSGYLKGDITAAPGFTPMPYGLPQLSSCEINTIIAWIRQGASDN